MLVKWVSGTGDITAQDIRLLHAAADRHPDIVEAALWAARELFGHHAGHRGHRSVANALSSLSELASRFGIPEADANDDDESLIESQEDESTEGRSKRAGAHRRRPDDADFKRAADNPYWSPLKTQKWGHRW